jgi:hypothetical protein
MDMVMIDKDTIDISVYMVEGYGQVWIFFKFIFFYPVTVSKHALKTYFLWELWEFLLLQFYLNDSWIIKSWYFEKTLHGTGIYVHVCMDRWMFDFDNL